jgi:hypothetical protein
MSDWKHLGDVTEMVVKQTAEKALQRAEDAAKEAEEASFTYQVWMAAWRARQGHHGPYDPDTGCPTI